MSNPGLSRAAFGLAAACVCVVSHSALGQSPQPREVAAVSSVQDESAVFETTLAVGEERVMSVFHAVPAQGFFEIGYAVATLDPNSGEWAWTEEGLIDPNGFTDVGLADPSVAYDSVTGDFVVCALVRDQTRVVVARYDASADPPQFGAWETMGPTGFSYDKPWIVAGEIMSWTGPPGFGPGQEPTQFQEFYITWSGDDRLKYLRSTDGGHNWIGGDALTDPNDPNSIIAGPFLPAPRVYDTRPLYVVYQPTSDISVAFARGNDLGAPHQGEVKFTRLLDPNGAPLTVDFNLLRTALIGVVPPFSVQQGARGPGYDLAADPTDADRLFLVYHDTATLAFDPNNQLVDADVNIYLRVLTRVQGAKWSVGERILVADDDVGEIETDQFMPAIDVDEDGGIHIIYYDDRNYEQDDDEQNPRYDVFYAFSDDQGDSWIERELCDDPQNDCAESEPAADFSDDAIGFTIRDYIGIDVGADRVWTCFMGTSDEQDPNPNQSVIWSTQIVLP